MRGYYIVRKVRVRELRLLTIEKVLLISKKRKCHSCVCGFEHLNAYFVNVFVVSLLLGMIVDC